MSSDVSLEQQNKLSFENVKYQFVASVRGKYERFFDFYWFDWEVNFLKNLKKFDWWVSRSDLFVALRTNIVAITTSITDLV